MSPRTHENYEAILTAFSTWLGRKKLSEQSPSDLERYKNKRKGSVSDQTINIPIRTLKAAMEVATKLKEIEDNPLCEAYQSSPEIDTFFDEGRISYPHHCSSGAVVERNHRLRYSHRPPPWRANESSMDGCGPRQRDNCNSIHARLSSQARKDARATPACGSQGNTVTEAKSRRVSIPDR